jgi:hypothetical protein
LLCIERGQEALLFSSCMLALNTTKIHPMFLTEITFYVHPIMSLWKWRSFSLSWLQAIAGIRELVLISNEAACCSCLAAWHPLQRKDECLVFFVFVLTDYTDLRVDIFSIINLGLCKDSFPMAQKISSTLLKK